MSDVYDFPHDAVPHELCGEKGRYGQCVRYAGHAGSHWGAGSIDACFLAYVVLAFVLIIPFIPPTPSRCAKQSECGCRCVLDPGHEEVHRYRPLLGTEDVMTGPW